MSTITDIPATGFLRERQVLEFFPFSRATLWSRVKSHKFPKPVKISEGITAWRAEDIRLEIERLSKT